MSVNGADVCGIVAITIVITFFVVGVLVGKINNNFWQKETVLHGAAEFSVNKQGKVSWSWLDTKQD